MRSHQEHVENLKPHGRHGEEIDGYQGLHVIVQERPPGLRRRLAVAQHVLADAGLADVDAEFEQPPVNARGAPERILAADFSDQIADLLLKSGACAEQRREGANQHGQHSERR
jgi:hypothetical protein